MKSLKQYILEALLNEGGKAVDGTPMTQKQAKEVFDDVVKHLLPLFGLEEENTDYAALGSFGKKHQDQTSGDIDIAVSLEKIAGFFGISINEVENKICELLDEKDMYYKMNTGLHVISTRWPIPNTEGLYGQVDLMPSYNMEFSKWMYHSPDFTKAESKYKGLYRNQLIMLTLKNVDQKVLSRNEKDEVMEFERYALRLNSGLAITVRSYVGKRGRKKNPEAIKELERQVTNVPDEIVKIAFGDHVKAKNVMNFEETYKIFMSEKFIHKEDRETIIEDFITEMVKGYFPIPSEVYDDWKELCDKISNEISEKRRIAAEKQANKK